MSAKTRKILRKIAELYSFGTEGYTVECCIEENYKSLLNSESLWSRLDEYDMDDVLTSIHNYWQYASKFDRPSVFQVEEGLYSIGAKKSSTSSRKQPLRQNICIERQLMELDRVHGRNPEALYYDYQQAVKYIIDVLLEQKIGREEYKKLSHSDGVEERSTKIKKAKEIGLFNNLDKILENVHDI